MIFFKKVIEIRSKSGILHFTRWAIFKCKWFALYIHKISEADKDYHLHSHPWNFISIILKGSYKEESLIWHRWPHYPRPAKLLKPKGVWTVSRMNRQGFHKIHRIIKGPVYSLFFTYGKDMSWFYMVNDTKIEHTIYREMKNKGEL